MSVGGPGPVWRPTLCRVGWVAVVVLATTGCDRRWDRTWEAGLSGPDLESLEAWLFCDDCDRGERDAVRRIGNVAVSPLSHVLIIEIPEEWSQNLDRRHGIAAMRAGLSGADSLAYVDRFRANFYATVHSRAALGLSDIRTPDAVQALQDALADSTQYRDDVVRTLQRALSAATTGAFQGTVDSVAAPFLDTVWITRSGGAPWVGNESVILNNSPFPNDVGIGFRGTDSLGFVAAARTGLYSLSITNIGPAQETEHAEFGVTSFPATATIAIRDVTAGPFPITILGSLSRVTSPPDTLHYFRFRPAADLTVTASVDWDGSSDIDLIWDDCSNRPVFGMNPGTVTGRVVNENGAALGSVQVMLVGTVITAMTNLQGRFFVSGVPAGWSGTLRALRIGFQTMNRPVREGFGEVWVVLRSSGSGPGAPFSGQIIQGSSPNSTSQTIPAGECRLLGLLKSDPTPSSTIFRLHIVSP